VEKEWEGIIPRWKNDERELFLGFKNNGREKFREVKTRDSLKLQGPELSYFY